MNWRSLSDDEQMAVRAQMDRAGNPYSVVNLTTSLLIRFVQCAGAKEREEARRHPTRELNRAFTVCLLKMDNYVIAGVAKRQPQDRELPLTGKRCALQTAVWNLLSDLESGVLRLPFNESNPAR